MVLGPLDKRSLRTRCEACARRRIKCEGRPPCIYCSKKKLICVPQVAKKQTGPVFVNATAAHKAPASTASCGLIQIPAKVPEAQSSQFIQHFFSGFLGRNNFAAGTLDLDTIVCQFQSSPSLYHASIAIGALDLSRKSTEGRKPATLAALNSYRSSIASFQTEIQVREIRRQDAGLWTTLFLGLFELMYDVSGEGWVKHILYGTSKILQIRGPEAHLVGRGRSFFLTVRVFEICRSLIYNEPSFLFEDGWTSLMSRMWEGDFAGEWHPKEELFDLIVSCSSLSRRVFAIVHPIIETPKEILDQMLLEFTIEGRALRSSLERWHSSFQDWLRIIPSAEDDPRSHLAALYYHGISIFLSGIFDHNFQFNNIASPTLPFEKIQEHVNGILSEAIKALETTNLAGILLLFPLRVAGSRVISEKQKSTILTMLNEISRRSFVVADAFVEDLMALWVERECG